MILMQIRGMCAWLVRKLIALPLNHPDASNHFTAMLFDFYLVIK